MRRDSPSRQRPSRPKPKTGRIDRLAGAYPRAENGLGLIRPLGTNRSSEDYRRTRHPSGSVVQSFPQPRFWITSVLPATQWLTAQTTSKRWFLLKIRKHLHYKARLTETLPGSQGMLISRFMLETVTRREEVRWNSQPM